MNDPPVILADEPTGALDSKSGDEVLALLKQLHAEGRTIILITHAENVAQHAGRIVRIQDGRILEDTGSFADQATESVAANHRSFESAVGLMASAQEALVTAWRSLRVNIFRTMLTLLGIIIGVAAVVAMLAVGEGSRQKVLDRISSFGTNLMLIRPGAAGIRNAGDIATLVPDDAAAIKALPNVETALPERSSSDNRALRQPRLSDFGPRHRRRLSLGARLAGGRRPVLQCRRHEALCRRRRARPHGSQDPISRWRQSRSASMS